MGSADPGPLPERPAGGGAAGLHRGPRPPAHRARGRAGAGIARARGGGAGAARRARLVGAAGQCPAGRPSAVRSRSGWRPRGPPEWVLPPSAARDPQDPLRPHGRRHQPRLSGRGRRTARPHHRARLRLAPRHVVGGVVGPAGATAGVVLPGDPLRQAGDGPLGPATPRRCRGVGGGHGSGARRGRLRAGSPARGDRRRAHLDPLRRDLPRSRAARSCSTARSPGSCGTTTTTRSGSGRRTSTPTSPTPRLDGVPASVSGSTARA